MYSKEDIIRAIDFDNCIFGASKEVLIETLKGLYYRGDSVVKLKYKDMEIFWGITEGWDDRHQAMKHTGTNRVGLVLDRTKSHSPFFVLYYEEEK